MNSKNYGTVDLHLHLDGSLSADMILELAKMDQVDLPSMDRETLAGYLSVSENCEDLNEYLECFDLPGKVLQSEKNLARATELLIEELAAQGLQYAEIRFAPQLHTQRGLSQEQVVKAVIEGRNRAMEANKIKIGLILCAMRGDGNEKANFETVEVAEKYLGHGVAAMDIAGAEALFPNEKYVDLFAAVADKKIPFTIHSGEALGVDSIRKALAFGAKRIGHGIRCVEDEAVMKELAEKKVVLELCPTSNLQTKALSGVNKIADYPIRTLIEHGILFTINTDNMVVSDTTISKEFEKLISSKVITEEEAEAATRTALEAAFEK